VQSITKLLTLPARFNAAETDEWIEQQKTRSIAAAILAQVNIAKRQVDIEERRYKILERNYRNAWRQKRVAQIKFEDGIGTKEQAVINKMDAALARVEKDLAYVALQVARARLLNSLGVDVWATEIPLMTLVQILIWGNCNHGLQAP
jgi:hypothetical protein